MLLFMPMPDYPDFLFVLIAGGSEGSRFIQVNVVVNVYRACDASLSFATCDAEKLSGSQQYQMHNLGKYRPPTYGEQRSEVHNVVVYVFI